MDTSDTYIKMCEQAVEIQEIRHAGDCVDRNEWWKPGDFAFDKCGDYIFNVCGVRHCAADVGYFNDDESIWLPCQDQLQDMLQPVSIDEMIHRFFEWYADWFMRQDALIACHTSMEQLWLSFVMKEKYDKVWDGEGWIKLD